MKGNVSDIISDHFKKSKESLTKLQSECDLYRKALESFTKGLFSTRNAKLLSEQALEAGRKIREDK